jgi:tetratricopeptide (TPR) repeat protein
MSDPLSALLVELQSSPGRADFPELVMRLREAGRSEDALELAFDGTRANPELWQGRIALALCLLDDGDLEGAQAQMLGALELGSGARGVAPEAPAALSTLDEIDQAIDRAAPLQDQMISANDIAERALEATLGAEDSLVDSELVAADAVEREDGELAASRSPFATETMAALLERQGDAAGARAIREALARAGEPLDAASGLDTDSAHSAAERSLLKRRRVIATLESWLVNLRRRVQ